MNKKAIIIGAGPGGLTAAYELLTRSNVTPIVLEKSSFMGGISRTVNYKGNRIDIGGHRFFSKSDRVMNWWLEHLPVEDASRLQQPITYHNTQRDVKDLKTSSPPNSDQVMLIRPRKSRIYYLRKLFDYPIRLSMQTLSNLGLLRSTKIVLSYLRSCAAPIKKVVNLEEFFINRFGRELYHTFFKSYTEKVWGVPCEQISAAWGEQRIKGLSIRKTLAHIFKTAFRKTTSGVSQKGTETSLIEQFMYPKYGPGQMWETVAQKVEKKGGKIVMNFDVRQIRCQGDKIIAVGGIDQVGNWHEFSGDYFFSTMPIKELICALESPVPDNVREVSDGLLYRDFITVGLLLKKMKLAERESGKKLIDDNWIYVQEPDVLAGRLQIFNNWSPHLVSSPDLVWIGAEYFCYETDELWKISDRDMTALAVQELHKIGIIDPQDVLDSTVLHMPKAYPAYFGTYDRFDEIRKFIDQFSNLFLIGRNGMHKYNNQDHSMLTAMVAVDNIIAKKQEKDTIWQVNTEMEYHESKAESPSAKQPVPPKAVPAVAKTGANAAKAGAKNR